MISDENNQQTKLVDHFTLSVRDGTQKKKLNQSTKRDHFFSSNPEHETPQKLFGIYLHKND